MATDSIARGRFAEQFRRMPLSKGALQAVTTLLRRLHKKATLSSQKLTRNIKKSSVQLKATLKPEPNNKVREGGPAYLRNHTSNKSKKTNKHIN